MTLLTTILVNLIIDLIVVPSRRIEPTQLSGQLRHVTDHRADLDEPKQGTIMPLSQFHLHTTHQKSLMPFQRILRR